MDKKKCFVISKIENDEKHYSNTFYEGIVVEGIKNDFDIIRIDKIKTIGNTYNDTIEHLENSELVIADLTELDPDVMFALGYRRKVGKPIIQFIQKLKNLPINLSTSRTIQYDVEFQSLKKARSELKEVVSRIKFDDLVQCTDSIKEIKAHISDELAKLSEVAKVHSRGNCFQRILEKYSDKFEAEDSGEDDMHDKLSIYLREVFSETFEYTDLQALANIFTPEGVVKEHEGKAREVWVATTKLDKDVRDEEIKSVVRKNLEDGKKYTYFVPKTKDVYRNMQVYQAEFAEFNNLYNFVILPEDSIVFFEEIAIYYPYFPDQERKGFASITIDDRDDAYIYVRQSSKIVNRYVEKLQKLIEGGSEIAEIINKLHVYMDRQIEDKNTKKYRVIKQILVEIILEPWLTKKSFDSYLKKLKENDAYDHILSVFETEIRPLLYEDIEYIKHPFLTEKSFNKIKEICESKIKNKGDIKLFLELIKPLILEP